MAGANGLAESARIMHSVIAAHGLARGLVPLGLPSVVPVNDIAVPAGAALLAVVNAPILPVGLLRLPRDFIARRRVIGLWAWELPVVPKNWHDGAAFVHEVWAPSQFTADAFEPLAPGRVRVVPYPLAAVDLPVAGDRKSLGLPADVLIVLTVFNLASSMVRKNPLGAIAAFKAAFGNSRDHLFVLKLSGTEAYPDDLRLIQAAIGDAKNIRLFTGSLPEAQLRGLIAASDIVLSLASFGRLRPDPGYRDAAGARGDRDRLVGQPGLHDEGDLRSGLLSHDPGRRPARDISVPRCKLG